MGKAWATECFVRGRAFAMSDRLREFVRALWMQAGDKGFPPLYRENGTRYTFVELMRLVDGAATMPVSYRGARIHYPTNDHALIVGYNIATRMFKPWREDGYGGRRGGLGTPRRMRDVPRIPQEPGGYVPEAVPASVNDGSGRLVPADISADIRVGEMLGPVGGMSFRTFVGRLVGKAQEYRSDARSAMVALEKAKKLAERYRLDRDERAAEVRAVRTEVDMWRRRASAGAPYSDRGERSEFASKRRREAALHVPEYDPEEGADRKSEGVREQSEVIARGGAASGFSAYGRASGLYPGYGGGHAERHERERQGF